MYLPFTTDLVAAEEGRTSGLLDEESDQEEYDVDEREESKGEEEVEDDDDEWQKVLSDYLRVLVNASSWLPTQPSQGILNSNPTLWSLCYLNREL